MRESKIKKNYQKNIERALILVLVGIIVLLMAFKRYQTKQIEQIFKPELMEVVEIPVTVQKPPERRPARPSMPIPTEDEDIPEDETIEDTEMSFDYYPPAPPPEEETETPYFVPYDKEPEIVGGYRALAQKLVYPEIARKAGVEGTVQVRVLISPKGEIIKTELIKSLGNNGCDEAAIKAIKSVKWNPAYQRDQPVQVWLSVSVRFKLK